MKNMLDDANANNYAVMAINCFNIETARAVIQAATIEDAPIIVNIFQDHLLSHCDSELIAPVVKTIAERSNVCVALNFDHGQEKEYLIKAIDDGFSSVMVDASRFNLEDNIKMTREIADYAHKHGASVEGEIGCLGASEGGEFTQDTMYTDPEQAKDFIEKTGIDSLAVAIGTAHGIYPKDKKPELKLDLLKTIRDTVDIPLVLHGGSSNPDEEIAESVKIGISKINISSDIKVAFYKKCREVLAENPGWIEPNAIYPPCIEAMKKVIEFKMELFNDIGKASLYK